MRNTAVKNLLTGLLVLLVSASASAQGNRLRAQAGNANQPQNGAGIEQPADAANRNGQMVHMMDRRFIMSTALGDLMEIDLSRLADSNASSDAVRAFAQRLTQDHERNLGELRMLAAAKGIMLPSGMMDMPTTPANGNAPRPSAQPVEADTSQPVGTAQPMMNGMELELQRMGLRHLVMAHQEYRVLLRGLTGSEFDDAWAGTQTKHHALAVADFELHARNARDPEIRAYAARTLPALQEHFQMARELAGLPRTAMAPTRQGAQINTGERTRTGMEPSSPASRVAGYRSGTRTRGARSSRRGVAH